MTPERIALMLDERRPTGECMVCGGEVYAGDPSLHRECIEVQPLQARAQTGINKGRFDLVGYNKPDKKVKLLLSAQEYEYLFGYVVHRYESLTKRHDVIAITPAGYYRHNETWRGWKPAI